MKSGFDISAVEIGIRALRGVDQLGREGEHIPEEWALLVDFVDIEARVDLQGGIVDQVKHIAIRLARVVEERGGLNARGWVLEVFLAVSGIATGLV